MRIKTGFTLLLSALSLSLSLFPPPALSLSLSAFLSQSLKVSPVIIETTIEPEGSHTRDIKVTNETDQFLPIQITPLTWDAEELSGDPFFKQGEEKDWLAVSETDLILEPGEVKEIEVRVSVPKDASPGGHYPAISFRPVLPASVSLGVATETEIIALLFITVPGEIETRIEIESFKPTQKVFYHRAPTFELTLKNLGNVHTRATGTLTASPSLSLSRSLSQPAVSSIPVPLRVLPGKSREFELETLKPGWLPGRYRASLSLSPHESPTAKLTPPIHTAETGFWYIPDLVPPFLLSVSVSLLYLAWRGRRRLIPALKVLVKG